MEDVLRYNNIAMDFWASLEHQLKYKQEIPEQEEIVARLKTCAETINKTDEEMLKIRKQMEEAAGIPTEEDMLFEKIQQIGYAYWLE